METVVAALAGAVFGIVFAICRARRDEIGLWYDRKWGSRRGIKPIKMVWVRCGGCRRYGEIQEDGDMDWNWVCGCGHENKLPNTLVHRS